MSQLAEDLKALAMKRMEPCQDDIAEVSFAEIDMSDGGIILRVEALHERCAYRIWYELSKYWPCHILPEAPHASYQEGGSLVFARVIVAISPGVIATHSLQE